MTIHPSNAPEPGFLHARREAIIHPYDRVWAAFVEGRPDAPLMTSEEDDGTADAVDGRVGSTVADSPEK